MSWLLSAVAFACFAVTAALALHAQLRRTGSRWEHANGPVIALGAAWVLTVSWQVGFAVALESLAILFLAVALLPVIYLAIRLLAVVLSAASRRAAPRAPDLDPLDVLDLHSTRSR